MAEFAPIFERGIRNEGGYKLTDISGDRGGQTYAGIARKSNPHWTGWSFIDRREIPPSSMVRDFYRAEFWDRIGGEKINSQAVAATLYDFAINAGWKVAVKIAQVVIGVTPDGDAGAVTIAALNKADPHTFALAFALGKIQRYADIVNRDRSQGKFLLGWVNRTMGELKQ